MQRQSDVLRSFVVVVSLGSHFIPAAEVALGLVDGRTSPTALVPRSKVRLTSSYISCESNKSKCKWRFRGVCVE